jgi:LIVCS family branched-chain amino acid:cation transporter
LACIGFKEYHPSTLLPAESILQSLDLGYGTMDLLGAFFYCSVAYHYIQLKCKNSNISDPHKVQRIMAFSCFIGALTTTLIYIGLMLASYFHAQQLHDVNTESLISAVSILVLGRFSAFFVCIFIFIASIATATALAEVSADFFTRYIFSEKLSRNQCLVMVLGVMYAMSILGFSMIMKLALPILTVLYPLLIVYTAYNLLDKKFGLHGRLFARKTKARLISVDRK